MCGCSNCLFRNSYPRNRIIKLSNGGLLQDVFFDLVFCKKNVFSQTLVFSKPNFIHVMQDGKIIKTGTAELAKELEQKGYEWLKVKS